MSVTDAWRPKRPGVLRAVLEQIALFSERSSNRLRCGRKSVLQRAADTAWGRPWVVVGVALASNEREFFLWNIVVLRFTSNWHVKKTCGDSTCSSFSHACMVCVRRQRALWQSMARHRRMAPLGTLVTIATTHSVTITAV